MVVPAWSWRCRRLVVGSRSSRWSLSLFAGGTGACPVCRSSPLTFSGFSTSRSSLAAVDEAALAA